MTLPANNHAISKFESMSDMNDLFFDLGDGSSFSGIYYYLQKADLNIKSELISVEHSREEIYIKFTAGNLSIWKTSIVKKVKKPRNIKDKFEFCYLIKNYNGEFLGCIGKPYEK
jgi:hypothetical protein